jgi:integrase
VIEQPTGLEVRYYVDGEPKSDRSRRAIVLPEVTVRVLRQHRASQLRERLIAGDRWIDSGFVFTTPIGTPLDASNVNKRFKALLKAAGLPPMRVHDLRHTCASLRLVQGVHPRLVMETLGHSQISLTLDTYSHVTPALNEDVARQMNAVLMAR